MKTKADLTERLRAEFLEMPGLRLTQQQVQRLCGIEPKICQLVLQELVNARFLAVKPDGSYTRSTEGRESRPQAARANLRLDASSAKAS